MSTKAEQYRLRAQEAKKQAEALAEPSLEKAWRDIATNWLEMAEQAERQGW